MRSPELGLVRASAQARCSPAKRMGRRNTRINRSCIKTEHISSPPREGEMRRRARAGTTVSARAFYGLVIARTRGVGPQLTADPPVPAPALSPYVWGSCTPPKYIRTESDQTIKRGEYEPHFTSERVWAPCAQLSSGVAVYIYPPFMIIF